VSTHSAEPFTRNREEPLKRSLANLTALVKTRLKRMQYRPALLIGLLARTGLEFEPFL
jgi:hypothetical protein